MNFNMIKLLLTILLLSEASATVQSVSTHIRAEESKTTEEVNFDSTNAKNNQLDFNGKAQLINTTSKCNMSIASHYYTKAPNEVNPTQDLSNTFQFESYRSGDALPSNKINGSESFNQLYQFVPLYVYLSCTLLLFLSCTLLLFLSCTLLL
eukprot:527537_1